MAASLRHIGVATNEDGLPQPEDGTASQIGGMVLARFRFAASKIVRDIKSISGSRYSDRFMIVHLLHGTIRGSANKQLINLRKGDVAVMHLSNSASLELQQCSVLCAIIPDAMLEHGKDVRILREGQLPCRMLSKHLMSTVTSLPASNGLQARALAVTTAALVQLCLDFSSENGADHGADRTFALIVKHIDTHLQDFDLRPDSLCAKFDVSRTWLYEAFRAHGGITRYIRDKRLDAAYRDLCGGCHERIIDIAYRWGFTGERQFQRAFLARFGVQPRGARERRKPDAQRSTAT